jgi:hypothetical protein
LEKRRRSELDGGGSAAAAGTRVPATGWLVLNNKQLGEVLWYIGKSGSPWLREESDWNMVLTERRQWRTAAARVGTRAREGRSGLSYKRSGRSVGVGRNVPVPPARVGRPRAWPATCAAPTANGTPRAVRRPADQRHLAQPLATDGTHECSLALRSDQRSHRRLGMRARSGYGAYGGGRRGRARRRARTRSGVLGVKCISLICFQNYFSPIFQTKLYFSV